MPNKMWNERYGAEAYAYGIVPNQFLQDNLSLFPVNGKILCLAEGEGRNAVHLAGQGFSVSGVDFSSAGKTKAEQLAKNKNVTIDYIVADLEHFDFGQDCWDGIISIFAHTPSQLRQNMHGRVKSALKTGGVFMLEAYGPKQLDYGTGGPKNLDMLISLDELQTAFNGFEIIHHAELEKTIIEGQFHTGQAWVTQFIGRKL